MVLSHATWIQLNVILNAGVVRNQKSKAFLSLVELLKEVSNFWFSAIVMAAICDAVHDTVRARI